MSTHVPSMTASIGLLVLRAGMGGYMLTHGTGKLQMLLDGQFEDFADPIGIGTTASLIGVVFAEFVCALLIVLGLATRLAAIPVVFAMGVAAFVVHGSDPWTMGAATNGSKEPALLFLTGFLTLVFTGAGAFSLDALIFRRKPAPEAA